jgi:hypothetical protein
VVLPGFFFTGELLPGNLIQLDGFLAGCRFTLTALGISQRNIEFF